MAEAIETLYIELQGRLDGLERALQQAEQRLAQAGAQGGQTFAKGVGSGVDQLVTKLGSIGGILAGGAVGLGVFDGLVRSVSSLAKEASNADIQTKILASTLEKSGINASAAQQSFQKTAETVGLLPMQLNESTTTLLRYGATLDQISKLQEAGAASALSRSRSAADGVQLIAEAIATENSALLNGIGIAGNLSTGYEIFAKQVGKTVDQLTQQEKVQASVNYLLKETQSEVEALPTLLGGLAGQQQKLTNTFAELRLEIGKQLIPAITEVFKVLNLLADNLPTVAAAAATLAAIIGAQRLAGAFSVLNMGVGQAISSLVSWTATSVTATTVTTGLTTALNALKAWFLTSPAIIIAAGAALITFAQQASSAIREAADAAIATDTEIANSANKRIATLRSSGSEIDQLKARIVNLQQALSSINLGEMSGDAEKTTAKIRELREELAKLESAQKTQQAAQTNTNELFKQARILLDAQAKALASQNPKQIYEAQKALDAFNKTGADNAKIVSAVQSAINAQNKELKENVKSTSDAESAAKRAAEAWSNYLKSERLDAYRRSLENLNEAQLKLEIANQRSVQAVDKLQAATQQLNAVQEKRLALEKEIAAQQANAPIQNTLSKLAQQYDLANISLQQYVNAINAYLAAYSKQLDLAVKGSAEYERLRGIILQLRDVQKDLNTELEVQADRNKKLLEQAPLTNTIEGLTQAYKSGSINALEYGRALEGLIQSYAKDRSALASSSIEYQRLDEVIQQLRDTQKGLADDISKINKALIEQADAAIRAAEGLQRINERGDYEVFDTVAQQYGTLLQLLDAGDIGPVAQKLARTLRDTLGSVRLDDGIKSAISDLIKQFDELSASAEGSGTPLREIYGGALESVGKEIDNLVKLSADNSISVDELTRRYQTQKNILELLIPLIQEQADSFSQFGASAEELNASYDALGKANQLVQSINTSLAGTNLQSNVESVNVYSATLENVAKQIGILNKLSEDGTITTDELSRRYESQKNTLELLIPLIQEQVSALTESGASAEDLATAYDALGKAKQSVKDINVALGETDFTLTFGSTDTFVGALETVSKQIDNLDELAKSASLSAEDLSKRYQGQLNILSLLVPLIQEQASALQESGASTEQLASAFGVLDNASESVTKINRAIIKLTGESPEAARILKESAQDWGEAAQKWTDIVGLLSTEGGIAEAFAVPPDAIDFQDALNGIIKALSSVKNQLDVGGTSAENYAVAQQNAVIQLEEFIVATLDQARALEESGKGGTESYNKLIDLLGQAKSGLDALTASIFEANVVAADFAPPVTLIDYQDALQGIASQLDAAQKGFKTGSETIDSYQSAIIATIDDLYRYISVLQEVSASYLASSDSADQAIGRGLLGQISKAKEAVSSLRDELYTIGSSAPRIESVKDEITKLGSELASVQIADYVTDPLAELEIVAADFAPPVALIDYQDALGGIAEQLKYVRSGFAVGTETIDSYQSAINATIADLDGYITVLQSVADGYLSSADSADQAIGNGLLGQIAKAKEAIASLRDELYTVGSSAPRIESVKDEITKLGSQAADVKIADYITDPLAELEVVAADFAPPATLIDFQDALSGIGGSLDTVRTNFEKGQASIYDYISAINAVIDDLDLFSVTVSRLAQEYLASSDAADRAFGQDLLSMVGKAQQSITVLRDELYKVGSSGPEIVQVKDEITKLGSALADIQIDNRVVDELVTLLQNVSRESNNLLQIEQLRIDKNESLAQGYRQQILTLSDLEQALVKQALAIKDDASKSEELAASLERVAETRKLIDELTLALVRVAPSAQALRIIDESAQNNHLADLTSEIEKVNQQIQITQGLSAAGLIDSDALLASYRSQLSTLNDLLEALNRQAVSLKASGANANRLAQVLGQIGNTKDQIDALNLAIVELQKLDLPGEFNVLSSSVAEAEIRMQSLSTEFASGAIKGEQYQESLVGIIKELDGVVQGLTEQRDAIQVVDEVSRKAYSDLNTVLLTASALIARTTAELQAAAAAAEVTARALRVLQDLGNEDVAQQVREGLRELKILLEGGEITDRINELSDQLVELAKQSLPSDVRDWFNQLMDELTRLRQGTTNATADYYQFEVANKQVGDGLLFTISALRRMGIQINTVQEALDAFKVYNIEINSDQVKELGKLLTEVNFSDFIERSKELAAQLPQTPLINFVEALDGIGASLDPLRREFQQSGANLDDYRQTLIDTIGGLQVFIDTVDKLSRQYAQSAEESDRALGAGLAEVAQKAQGKISGLNNELRLLGVAVLDINDLTEGFDRFDRTLARFQIPNILPDNDVLNLLKVAGIDFTNIDQLARGLKSIPAFLQDTSGVYSSLADLVSLATQAEDRLAAAAGRGVTENQKLGNEIEKLVKHLLDVGVISDEVAQKYLAQAAAISALKEQTKNSIDIFRVLAEIKFDNFSQLTVLLERTLAPLQESSSAADLFNQALRAAAAAEQDLGTAVDSNNNRFRTQADNIRELTARLAATGNVGADVIQKLTDLSGALDIRAVAEDSADAAKKLENSLQPVKNIFAEFSKLNIPGLDSIMSLGEGISKLIGGNLLGGIAQILQPYANLLKPILEPLAKAFSELLDTLNPIITSLGEVLVSVLVPIVRVVSAVLIPVFKVLGDVISGIGKAVEFVFSGIITIYNATIGKLFGQIGGLESDGLISRIEAVIGKVSDAMRDAILEMSRNIQDTLSSSFASALSDGLFEAIQSGDLDKAKQALQERLKKVVVQVIIDTAVKAALATAAVAGVLKDLSDAIAYAIATGDWSKVGSAIDKALSTVTGIMDSLLKQLTPALGRYVTGTTPPGGGGGTGSNPINPFQVSQLPQSPDIAVPLLDSAKVIGDSGAAINDAAKSMVDGLKELELPSVASDMARSSRDFRVAVDDLSSLLANRTDWSGVNSR